jgi:hypothetical protein
MNIMPLWVTVFPTINIACMVAMGISTVHSGTTYFPYVFIVSLHTSLPFKFSYCYKRDRSPVFRLQLSKHSAQKNETERNEELINISAFYSGDLQLEFG